jgi:hypothetical protein
MEKGNGALNDRNNEMPKFKWELNINTVAVIVGFGIQFAALGYAYSEHVSGLNRSVEEIGKLWSEVRRLDTADRNSTRAISGLDYRVTSVEAMARESVTANRETSVVLNELKSDLKVAREILQRLEATSNRNTTP